ncbi:CAP domain-containing protein [uncultured Dokdonia sp.]|uniref:CAP domain-containing protein n=1 Tax=uncultured Dokdonia sp. TaxID=575653 RepID=UPI0026139DBB|nr:CAP domain-containing protein [uncultured Dokdonia sp.]
MKLITNTLFVMGLVCLLVSCSPEEIDDTTSSANFESELSIENNNAMSSEILTIINDYRATLDLPPFSTHHLAKEEALDHTAYMIINNRVSHDNFFERSDYLKDNGASVVSENVAFGYRTAQAVVDGWLNSPSHKEAIEGNFTHSGISVAQTENGINFFTHIFVK